MQRPTVESILRTTQAYCGLVCQKQTLEYGIAYYSERFAHCPEANQYREIIADSPETLERAMSESTAWFAERNLTCHRWAPSADSMTPELSAFLATHQFRQKTYRAMRLMRWVESLRGRSGSVAKSGEAVRILPARPMRHALRNTFVGAADSEIDAELCMERLNDPQYDMFVAMEEGDAIGRCALYQVGDIARVVDLHVVPGHEDRNVDAALLTHALLMAKRLAMRTICVQCADTADSYVRLFERFGFEADGTIVEFDRETPGRGE